MSMSDSSFEYILQELHSQKQRMEELQAENSELRRQLTDLRNGRGIFVEILGLRFPLAGVTGAFEALLPLNTETGETQEEQEAQEAPTVQMMPVTVGQPIEQAFPNIPTIPETPLPVEEPVSLVDQATEEYVPTYAASFLDEDFAEDFSDAVTSQIAVWNGAPADPRQKPINEDEKAALRRELIGSFLLE